MIERQRKRGTKPSLPLADYAGTYQHPAYGIATITQKDGELTLNWSRFRCLLSHYQDDIFRAQDDHLGAWPIRFTIEKQRIIAMDAINVSFTKK